MILVGRDKIKDCKKIKAKVKEREHTKELHNST